MTNKIIWDQQTFLYLLPYAYSLKLTPMQQYGLYHYCKINLLLVFSMLCLNPKRNFGTGLGQLTEAVWEPLIQINESHKNEI